MEIFLDKIEENIDYDKWYCCHFYTEKQIDKLEFMFGRIKLFNKDEFYPKYNKNGYEIVRDAYSQDEVIYPKCHSKDILVIKGNGFRIDGTDWNYLQ